MISILVNVVGGAWRTICAVIDTVAFSLIDQAYNLIVDLSTAKIVRDGFIKSIMTNIYIIISIFALFRLAVLLINSIINPDKLTEKGKGLPNMLVNIVITFTLLIVVKPLFDKAYDLQGTIVEREYIQKIFTISGETRVSNKDAGDTMRSYAIGSLITLNEDIVDPNTGEVLDGAKCDDKCEKAVTEYLDLKKTNKLSMVKLAKHMNKTGEDINDEKSYIYDYKTIATLICACFITYILFSYAIDIAVRLVELAALEILAPLFIVTYIDPNSAKSGPFNKWLKTLGKTFLSLFIKLAILELMMVFMGMIPKITVSGDGDLGPMGTLLVMIGILIFAKKAPKWIGEMVGADVDTGGGIAKKLGGAALVGGALSGGVTKAKQAVAGAGLAAARNYHAARQAARKKRMDDGNNFGARFKAAKASGGVKGAIKQSLFTKEGIGQNFKNQFSGLKSGLKGAVQGTIAGAKLGVKAGDMKAVNEQSKGIAKDTLGMYAPGFRTIGQRIDTATDNFGNNLMESSFGTEDDMKKRKKLAEAKRIHTDIKYDEKNNRDAKKSFQSREEFEAAVTGENIGSKDRAIVAALKAQGDIIFDDDHPPVFDDSGNISKMTIKDSSAAGGVRVITDKKEIQAEIDKHITEYGQKAIASWQTEIQQTQNATLVGSIDSYNKAAQQIVELDAKQASATSDEAKAIIKTQIDRLQASMETTASAANKIIAEMIESESSYTADPSKCPGAQRAANGKDYVTSVGRFTKDEKTGGWVYKATDKDGKPVNINTLSLPVEQSLIQQGLSENVTKAKEAFDKIKEKLYGKKE